MKDFVLEFTNSEWTLYQYDEELNNLPDIKGSEISKYFNLPDLAYVEDEYTSIVAEWDNIEQQGYIDIEVTAIDSDITYPKNFKFNDFCKFIKAIKDLKNIIDIFKLDITAWEYENRHPYKSKGLSMKDFL